MKNNSDANLLLDVKGLKTYFPIRKGFMKRTVGYVKAVDGVNLTVHTGETVGLVGESGCGKTTTGQTIVRLIKPVDGEIRFNDPKRGWLNLERLAADALAPIRPQIQMIFQDPFSSLDPRMTVGRIIAEPLWINRVVVGSAQQDRVAELLRTVGLRPEYASRYPHAFSGGQRQRIGIARALALNPKLIICDEPVSALDVSIQAQVLNLLEDLQAQLGLSYLFIAHDLSVVAHISDRVAVMYVGQLVEFANSEDLYCDPKHPYTEALLAAVPKPDPMNRTRPVRLPGEVPSPANPPAGCRFHPRCQYAKEICKQEIPSLVEINPGHQVACHLADELHLRGVVKNPSFSSSTLKS